MTGLKRTIAAAAALLATGIAGSTGYALHTTTTNAPRACHSPYLPSGDAIQVDTRGNAWSFGSRTSGPVRWYVCTDGTWVHVTGYGNTLQASTAAAGGWYSQDNATCRAFGAYERHPDRERFAVMLKDSRSALHYLRIDVAWWNADRKHHASSAELATDKAFVSGDCTDPAAQMDS